MKWASPKKGSGHTSVKSKKNSVPMANCNPKEKEKRIYSGQVQIRHWPYFGQNQKIVYLWPLQPKGKIRKRERNGHFAKI